MWKPLTKEQTEQSEETKYGMIFHALQEQVTNRSLLASLELPDNSVEAKSLLQSGQILSNNILPIGFQPFMRCHMQYGYGIKLETEYPLQHDFIFEKLRFRHNEKLSREVYELMDGGKKIYPNEGLNAFEDQINGIRNASVFSDAAFDYAFEKSRNFTDKEKCRKKILDTKILGIPITLGTDMHPFKLSRQRKRCLDRYYQGFSLEKEYGIKLTYRLCYTP